MLDARTGALVRRAAVGQGAGALAVDERTGHVFVQNVGENTVSMLDARSGVLLYTITLGDGPSILAQARTTGGPLPTTVVRSATTVVDGVGQRLMSELIEGK